MSVFNAITSIPYSPAYIPVPSYIYNVNVLPLYNTQAGYQQEFNVARSLVTNQVNFNNINSPNNFTFSFWVAPGQYRESDPNRHPILLGSHGTSSAPTYHVGFESVYVAPGGGGFQNVLVYGQKGPIITGRFNGIMNSPSNRYTLPATPSDTWSHIVCGSNNGIAFSYVNGVKKTNYITNSGTGAFTNLIFQDPVAFGGYGYLAGWAWSSDIAEFYYLDGVARDPTYFAAQDTDGYTYPINYGGPATRLTTSDFGNAGWYWNFTGDLTDSSGLGNTWWTLKYDGSTPYTYTPNTSFEVRY